MLLVGTADDQHISAIGAALDASGVPFLRAAVSDFGSVTMTSSHTLELGQSEIAAGITVFWRDAGVLEMPDSMRAPERELLDAEAHALFLGALMARRCRWVDHPHRLASAANKVLQLVKAREAGIRTPAWLVTNDPARAAQFIAAQPTLAKSVSSGAGLTPEPGVVMAANAHYVRRAPTMLQEIVDADFDVWLVTVGRQTLAWQRPRTPGDPIAWRVVDPEGTAFVRAPELSWHAAAAAFATTMGVSTSVQDWLVRLDGEPVFLELNTRGAWLFLPGAEDLLPPLFADILASDV